MDLEFRVGFSDLVFLMCRVVVGLWTEGSYGIIGGDGD